jgi:hypothetical protein
MTRLRIGHHETPQGDQPLMARACDHQGCGGEGLYRAPKGRDRLNEYYVFCLDHVRDYNRAWDFYRGMSEDEIETHIRNDTVWQRPTWPLGSWGFVHRPHPLGTLRDAFGIFIDRHSKERRRRQEWQPSTPEEKALDVLGLKPPTAFAAIKARYKELVKRLHPDANGGDKTAEERLKVVNRAYSTLKQAAQAAGR